MKTRILAVCPYEALQDLILDIAQERDDVEVTSVVGDLSEGQRLLERVRGMLEGCDAIISRGGTMRMLQENVQTPVIEISSNGFDIMRIVRLLRDYTGKYALIGTHKTEQDARMICEMLGSSIDLYTLPKDQNPYEQLKTLKEQGYQLVIGGVTVNLTARSLGMNALLITSGREAISAAMDEAVRICRLTAQYKLENQLLRALLTSEGGGAAILDDQGRLLYRSSSLPDVPVDALRKQFEAVLRFGDLATHIRIDQKPYTLQGRRCTIGNAPYVLLRISPCYYIESGMQSWISAQRFSIGSRLFFSTLNGHSEAAFPDSGLCKEPAADRGVRRTRFGQRRRHSPAARHLPQPRERSDPDRRGQGHQKAMGNAAGKPVFAASAARLFHLLQKHAGRACSDASRA